MLCWDWMGKRQEEMWRDKWGGECCGPGSVTKSGVWMLTTQKPIKRQSWWKRKFALLWMLAMAIEVGGTNSCPNADSPTHWQSVGKRFYRGEKEATCRNTIINSEKSSWNWSSMVWTGSSWLGCCKHSSSSVPGLICSHFYEAACVIATVVNFFHVVGVSVSTRQFIRYGSEYYLQPLRRN